MHPVKSNWRAFGHTIAASLGAAACLFAVDTSAADPERSLRVMTFNIRYGTADDGENAWDRRREFLVETIHAFDPDLLGTQETLAFQRDYLAEQLPEYTAFGAGRDDGKEQGEMAALFFRSERFEQLDGGHFWLSETPDVPGSKSWDSALTRIVTWVRLRDRQSPDAAPLVYFNTHFDHRGVEARRHSAELLRGHIDALSSESSVILTGDFNAGERSPPHAALFGPIDSTPPRLIDAYRQAHPAPLANEGTFSHFQSTATSGPRIDWIGCTRDWRVTSSEIDRTARDGRTPSDHFPVTAVLQSDR
ncbi:MAG: endonuclease/exonuclease/phosphatase family protein [Planctomycetaceae bacterium]|nr:endonuclease/exonuclease/phosphatase family protein [Planctomycetaceae bacterium]